MSRKTTLVALASLLSWAAPAGAQPPVDDTHLTAPLHVASAEAGATLTRHAESIALGENEPLVDGDRILSGPARLEIQSESGDRVFVDERSVVDILDDAWLRLVRGRLRFEIKGSASTWRVETSGGVARLDDVGSYSVVIVERPTRDETEVIVWRGSAALETAAGVLPLSSEQRGTMSAFGAPGGPAPASALPADAFDRWVDQAIGAQTDTASSPYLPAELSPYSVTLEQSGTWSHEPEYGYVWYPTVSVGWRPYWRGWWRPTAYYGYVWVGPGAWTWPTHHYGWWGFGARGWYWSPSAVWRPAHVAWSVGPGYVGWCPLGWGNRPVAPFPHHGGGHGSYGVTPYGTTGRGERPGGRGGHGPDPWSTWNVVRADHFRSSRPVWTHAVDARTIPSPERSAFVEQRVPPRIRSTRTTAALSTAPRAVERVTTPGSRAWGSTLPMTNRREPANLATSPLGVPREGQRPTQPGRPTATPRWTPPPVHYGIPPVDRADQPASRDPVGAPDPTWRGSAPGYGRSRSPVQPPAAGVDEGTGVSRAPRGMTRERVIAAPSFGGRSSAPPPPSRPTGGSGMAVPRGASGGPHGAPAARGAAPSRGSGGAPPSPPRGGVARPRSR